MNIPCCHIAGTKVGLSNNSSHICNICYLDGHYYAVDLQQFVESGGGNDMINYCMKLLD